MFTKFIPIPGFEVLSRFMFSRVMVIGVLFGSMFAISQGQVQVGMGLAVLSVVILFWSFFKILFIIGVVSSIAFFILDLLQSGALPI